MSTVAQVLGQNVKRLRHERGWTLDDLARAGHNYGQRWNTGRISKIEKGNTAPTIELLLVLAEALRTTTNELLHTDQNVEIGEGVEISGDELTNILHRVDAPAPSGEDPAKKAALSLNQRIKEARDAGVEGFTTAHILGGMRTFALTDERAAQKLNMTQGEYIARCMKTWGHLLSAEVERRAEEGATAQKKGHITRGLLREIEQDAGKR